MRKMHMLGVAGIAFSLALGAVSAEAAIAKNDRGYTTGLTCIQLNGKTFYVKDLTGGDTVRFATNTSVTRYTSLEFDVSMSEFLAVAPEFSDIIAGRAGYAMTLLTGDFDYKARSASQITSSGITLTFPMADPASKNAAFVHIALTPTLISDTTPPARLPAKTGKDKMMLASNYRVTVGGLAVPNVDFMNSSVTLELGGTSRGELIDYGQDIELKDGIGLAQWSSHTQPGGVIDWVTREMASTGYSQSDPSTWAPLDITYLSSSLGDAPALTLHFDRAWPVRVSTLNTGDKKTFSLMALQPSLVYVSATAKQIADAPADDPVTQTAAADPVKDTGKDSGKPVDPSAIQPPSKDAVLGQTYYADDDHKLAVTLTDVRYDAGRYAYDGAELVPGDGFKVVVATFDLTNVTAEEQHLPYGYRAAIRDAKGSQRESDGIVRAEDGYQGDVVIAPGETMTFDAASLMSAAWPAQQIKLGVGSGGENVYTMKGDAVDLLPAAVSPDGVAFPVKVPSAMGQWYPIGVLDARLDGVETTRAEVDGAGPGDNYAYLLTTWKMRNRTRRDQNMPYGAMVTAYDSNGASWYSTYPLDESLTSMQPGFAPEDNESSEHSVRFAIQVPAGVKIARIEYSESGSHTFVYKP